MDNLDRNLSQRLQSNNNKLVEAILFCIPAHLFNRVIVLIPVLITLILGAKNYDHMLTVNGFKAVGENISDGQRISYGLCFASLYMLCLLLMVCCTQLMKYTIKRERPKRRSDTTRISDLRVKENGTYSMPSGDSAAAAVFCVLVTHEMGMPFIYILMPLVMMGRVYYQCHWFGDTVIGFIIGTFWGVMGTSYFAEMVPLF